MPRKWYTARVISIEDISPSVKELVIKISGKETFNFSPGQFLTFDLPIGEKRLERWRSYSIANCNNATNRIHLIVSYIEGGGASEYFFKKLKSGEVLKFKGPEGKFTLPEKINKSLVMVCTGTGVAPFKSMIEHVFKNKIEHKKIHLIYGTRKSDGILYKDYFEKLDKVHESFEFSVALSREPYKGYQGYVHDIYLKRYKKVNKQVIFYLCGWQNMIDQAQAELLKQGFQKDQIYFELYG